MVEQQVIDFIHRNALFLWVGYFFFMACVSNLPVPDDNSSALYKWFYGTAHTISGNIAQAGSVLKQAAVKKLNVPQP